MGKIWKRLTFLSHFVSGMLTAAMSIYSVVLAILMFLVFLIYELNEDWHIKDEAWRDILSYGLGIYLMAVVFLILGGLDYVCQ